MIVRIQQLSGLAAAGLLVVGVLGCAQQQKAEPIAQTPPPETVAIAPPPLPETPPPQPVVTEQAPMVAAAPAEWTPQPSASETGMTVASNDMPPPRADRN